MQNAFRNGKSTDFATNGRLSKKRLGVLEKINCRIILGLITGQDFSSLLCIPTTYPALFVAGSAISSLGLVICSPAKAIDYSENYPPVVPDRMRIGEAFIQVGMGGKVH
jgi:hypothetical protein